MAATLQMFSVCILGQLAFYCLGRYLLGSNVKKRAWLLTLPVSFIFGFIVGPYHVWTVLAAMFQGSQKVSDYLAATYPTGEWAAVHMITFMLLDLGVGCLEYPSELRFDTGYIHHSMYLILYSYLYLSRKTNFLLIGACCEIPTFIMAAGILFPTLRSDLAFGFTFFLTRIFWFVVVFVVFCNSKYNPGVSVWWGLSLGLPGLYVCEFAPPVLAATLVHCLWFSQWCTKYGAPLVFGSVKKKIE